MIYRNKPEWLKIKIPSGPGCLKVKNIIRENHLHTVCDSAKCPNKEECWSKQTATFMILGDNCTRNCRFCAVQSNLPLSPDPDEPAHIAQAVNLLNLNYAVITCVTRDDLPDGGADHWRKTIEAVRHLNPDCRIEVLISDLNGNTDDLDCILSANPDVLGHNLETVERLYPLARPQANYERSLRILDHSSKKGFITKTGIMIGLGEKENEVVSLMKDAQLAGADILTIGQYLQPSKEHLSVIDYIKPSQFRTYEKNARAVGLKSVMSSPLVRSSYRAEDCYHAVLQQ